MKEREHQSFAIFLACGGGVKFRRCKGEVMNSGYNHAVLDWTPPQIASKIAKLSPQDAVIVPLKRGILTKQKRFMETAKWEFLEDARGNIRMPFEYNGKLLPRAKEMRKQMTPQEQHLWYGFLRRYPVRFQRQKVIGQYIADFYCHQARLIIEVDGGQHLTPDAQEYDSIRTMTLNQLQLTVLRFQNTEVEHNFALVCNTIQQALQQNLSL